MKEGKILRPILVSIPHAGSVVPDEVSQLIALSPGDLLGYADLYTDRIFGIPGVYQATTRFSRVIVDVNRAPDDISKEYEEAAEGVIVHTTWDGRKVYKTEPSTSLADRLIQKYHEPFHEEVDALMPKVRFLFDCHSYLPVGPVLKHDGGRPRPDVNLGNMNYSSCSREHTVFIRNFFLERGYSVEINFPYAGKYILGHHCHRRRIPPFLVPGIQIELNQGLYVKEGTFEPVLPRIEEFAGLFERLVNEFAKAFVA